MVPVVSHWTDTVCRGSRQSATTSVTCYVPLGSVLVPILFIIYTPDSVRLIEHYGLIVRIFSLIIRRWIRPLLAWRNERLHSSDLSVHRQRVKLGAIQQAAFVTPCSNIDMRQKRNIINIIIITYTILNTSLISPRALRYFRVGNFNLVYFRMLNAWWSYLIVLPSFELLRVHRYHTCSKYSNSIF